MKKVLEESINTIEAVYIEHEIYKVVITFNDNSFFTILIELTPPNNETDSNFKVLTEADNFIFNLLSENLRTSIFEACMYTQTNM